MAYEFEIGKTYRGMDRRMKPFTVTRRTKLTVWGEIEGRGETSMRIKHDEKGNEYIVNDSGVSPNLRGLFIYEAEDDYHG